jgi:aminodeoxyfutalosine synthase
MHGLSVAQLSLNYGVDDLDGSVVEYKITHDADHYGTPGTMHREDLLHMIWDAGFRPVERNTRYETVKDYGPPPSQAERRATPQSVLS